MIRRKRRFRARIEIRATEWLVSYEGEEPRKSSNMPRAEPPTDIDELIEIITGELDRIGYSDIEIKSL